MGPFVSVLLLSPPYSILTYALPDYLPRDAWFPGCRVLAPLGNGSRAAVLLDTESDPPPGVEVKPLLWPLEREPLLDADYLDMARNLAARQCRGLGEVLAALLPQGFRSAKVAFEDRSGGRPRRVEAAALRKADQGELERLAGAWMRGEMGQATPLAREAERYVILECEPPWPIRPGAKRQEEVLEFLLGRGDTPLPVLKSALGDGADRAVSALADKGLVRIAREAWEPAPEKEGPADDAWSLEPTAEQAEVIGNLREALERGAFHPALLHGVTGSGKTLVYLHLARACLEAGRSVLVLAPEVALALALYRRFHGALGEKVAFHHGYQARARREKLFERAARSPEPTVVVGTRSSLFLPQRDLGLVILDEEHDESFKQEERLSYQAKEVAWFRCERAGAVLLLGSATPDVKTYQAGESGAMVKHTLANRVGGGRLPGVDLVDMSQAGPEPLGSTTAEALQATVEAGEQAVILLNRRGYAPIMFCQVCREPVGCPECKVSLTFHKARGRLLCHYCGHSSPFPCVCGQCGQADMFPMGEGTERLEERLGDLLPSGTNVLRLDRDAGRNQERMEAILAKFARGEAQVLVGTQMLSKGHHFPDVTLAVAADADLGLNLPDYRAAERVFQLLVQVSGRAGRGEKPGRVLIQTRSPSHPFWNFVLRADYEGFFRRELEMRRRFGYPPFAKLGLIRLSHKAGDEGGASELKRLSSLLRERAAELGVRMLGPAPAPLAQLKGRLRFHCLCKADAWPDLRSLYAEARSAVGRDSPLRLNLDLDPLNML